jgi:HEAT repeat protein
VPSVGLPDIEKLKAEKNIAGLAKAVSQGSDAEVRRHAAEALDLMGDGVAPLIAALSDPDRYMRQAAARALGRFGDGRAVEPLAAALRE